MEKQIHVLYTGKVQGVGFRFTSESIARSLQVSGWVKNLSNGQVEVVAEAEEELLKDFLARINQVFARYIRDTQVDWQDATGEFDTFEIGYE
ncbi:MAG: acylphosphatase [Candidatus Omnitrophota bacterium]|jgi:acylphosphatase